MAAAPARDFDPTCRFGAEVGWSSLATAAKVSVVVGGPGFRAGHGRAYVWPLTGAGANGDHTTAFARYHARLAPLLRSNRRRPRVGLAFAPRGRVQLAVRRRRRVRLPARILRSRARADHVELPALPVA